MTSDTMTLLAQRRQLLRAALRVHIDAGRLSAHVLDYIDALYARRRDFEAERIAGLALWLGTSSSTTWRETCFEGCGVVLRAGRTVLHGIASVVVQHRAMPEQDVTVGGLSPACATRWSQLGQRRLSLSGTTLPERGRRVQQLIQWLGGTTAAEGGFPHGVGITPEMTALAVVELAAEETVQAIRTVSHCLWQVWVQRTWRAIAPSCDVFLEREIGVGAPLGAALIALAEERMVWDLQPQPLSRLEAVVMLLLHATSLTTTTERKEYGGSR